MPATQAFCSHCGSAQTVELAAGMFVLHCTSCQSTTVGLGCDWMPTGSPCEIPLPPVVHYQEKSLGCTICDASLEVELMVRSTQPCTRCASIEEVPGRPIAPVAASTVSAGELAFLSTPSAPSH